MQVDGQSRQQNWLHMIQCTVHTQQSNLLGRSRFLKRALNTENLRKKFCKITGSFPAHVHTVSSRNDLRTYLTCWPSNNYSHTPETGVYNELLETKNKLIPKSQTLSISWAVYLLTCKKYISMLLTQLFHSPSHDSYVLGTAPGDTSIFSVLSFCLSFFLMATHICVILK